MGLGHALQKYQVGGGSFWWHSDTHGDVLAQGVDDDNGDYDGWLWDIPPQV